MRLSRGDLDRMASESGFPPDPLERVVQLLDLLDALRTHPYLAERLVLKGGTALNLFLFDTPRLSVDIDLNYIGSLDRDAMLTERPLVEQAIHAVCARQKLSIHRVPAEHAGGKWRLGYDRADGKPGRLELDLNYLLRAPLWTPSTRDSLRIGPVGAHQVRVLDFHELVAGKLAALFGRTASRDVFDVHTLLTRDELTSDRLRLAFVVYGAMNRRDWRTVSTDDIQLDPVDAEQRLLPLLRTALVPQRRELKVWCERLVAECRERLAIVLPLQDHEREFIGLVNDRGEIEPELLTSEVRLLEVIRLHPALQWKAIHARKRAGLDTPSETTPDAHADGDPDPWP